MNDKNEDILEAVDAPIPETRDEIVEELLLIGMQLAGVVQGCGIGAARKQLVMIGEASSARLRKLAEAYEHARPIPTRAVVPMETFVENPGGSFAAIDKK